MSQWEFEDIGNGLYYVKNETGVYLEAPEEDTGALPLECTPGGQAWRLVEESSEGRTETAVFFR